MKRGKQRLSKRRDEVADTTSECPTHTWNRNCMKLAMIAVLAAVPYLPSLSGDFVFDDAATIVNNPVVNGRESILKVFITDYWGQPIASPHSHKSYRPLTTLTFWLNYRIHGDWTLPYHLINIALHVVVTLLVFVLVRRIRSDGDEAAVAASLFAIHPVHTEAVANISGRAELLMSVFAMTTLLYYQLCLRNNDFCLRNAAIFVTMATCAVLSKEQGITAIPLCLVLEFLCHPSKGGPSLLRCSTMIFFTCALTLLRFGISGFEAPKFTELDNSAAFVADPVFRMASYSYLWLVNLRLLLLPHSLCFDYSMGCIPSVQSWTDLRILAQPVVAMLCLLGALLLLKTKDRFLCFGIVFGIFTFLPASNLLVIVGFTIAERVLYLPSVGICIVAAWLSGRLRQQNVSAEKILMAVLILGAAVTYERCEEWQTELDLYSSGLRVCPQNAKIHYNLGKVLSRNGDIDGAEYNYWNAIRLNPRYEHAMNNLANILEAKGRSEEAELLLRKAIKSRPTFAVAWMNLGITLMNQEKYEEAHNALQMSLKLRPSSADCLFNLGNLYQKLGKTQEALNAWRSATILDAGHSKALTNLFVALDERDECSTVVATSRNVPATLVSHSAPLAFQIGVCLGKQARFIEAERHLRIAIQLQPNNSMYHANLGVLYQRWARYKLAESSYLDALLIDAETNTIKWNLQVVQEKLNKTKLTSRFLSFS